MSCVPLKRSIGDCLSPYGSPDYSREELVAELGAAFLAAHAGISPQTIEQSAAYLDGWRKQLAGDKKLIVQAAGAAQRAADYIRSEPDSRIWPAQDDANPPHNCHNLDLP
ncbi:zincin-like metallopeptidase domain-containing protein [Posidoniimonas polymericola]|uniref:zincin-like metallopeptidase domain-containing protein n=1 Tax=Posidoniimonas polymericola TaxID=2528002 RepID=UPI0018D289FE|nr:zincin-like metallopeptidase domain-containing protein [Posidoniimonas polymericola]